METETKLLLVGLPETGKTTYFVALDEVLHSQTDPNGLVSAGFTANRAYLEGAKKMWRAGKDIGRTNLMTIDEPIELLIRCPRLNITARLTAPDVNGEFFNDQWADRQWPISYRTRLSSLSGLFLFVHAQDSGRNAEISSAWQRLASDKTSVKKPWEPRAAAKQVKLVDLLQFIAERSATKQPVPLAMIVSAWDVIMKSANALRPDEFIKGEYSLLHQYLESNPELYRPRVFGVSARGGDNAAQADLVKLRPHERVYLKDGDTVTKDITAPLRWVLGWS